MTLCSENGHTPDAGRHDSRRLAHPTPRHPQTPALAILAAAWPRLSLADQKAILAIVRASGGEVRAATPWSQSGGGFAWSPGLPTELSQNSVL